MRAFRAVIATGILVALVMVVVVPLHAQAEAASLRVMSYNLHRGRGRDAQNPCPKLPKQSNWPRQTLSAFRKRDRQGVTNWRSSPTCLVGTTTWAKAPTF